jgi:hypothetical protein
VDSAPLCPPFGGKPDIERTVAESPLTTLSGHRGVAFSYRDLLDALAGSGVLRCRHQRQLDAPTLLARADGLIELKRLISAHGTWRTCASRDGCPLIEEADVAPDDPKRTSRVGFHRQTKPRADDVRPSA